MFRRELLLRKLSFVVMVGVGFWCFDIIGGLLFGALWLVDTKPGWAWS